MADEHRLRPIDFFLTSPADSYGRRAMAVVLTCMGRDSVAGGGQAVSQAGGTVLVQSPGSAEHPGYHLAVSYRPDLGRMAGTRLDQCRPPDDRTYAQQQWQEAADSRTPVSTRFRLSHAPSQTWRYTQVRAIPLYHDDGTVRGWMGMSTDLTK